MQFLRYLCLTLFVCLSALAQTPDVGSGSPNGSIQQAFVEAFYRNNFSALVSLPPLADVHKFGTTGLIQEFPDAAKDANVKLALVKPNLSTGVVGAVNTVFQVQAAMYAYYLTVSQSIAGYPANDTAKCPVLRSPSNSTNTCQWQLFDKNYALFTYAQLQQLAAQNFATREPYYTKWNTFGGIGGLGPADSAETQVTSKFSSVATVQTFDQGAIYNITSGLLTGRLLAVKEPIYDLYVSTGGAAGLLGFPATEELVIANGLRRQTFEGGSIDYDPSTGIPVLRTPLATLTLQPAATIHLNLGDARQLQVTAISTTGAVLTDRTVSWSTSNGRVVQVQPAGLTATITAVGGGTATITATAEGKTSNTLSVFVTAPCCQIGEGTPTASLQQEFQDAVTRNKLDLQLPAVSPAARLGNGYVQPVVSAAATPVPYLIAVPDRSATGYLVGGAILSQYLALGGPAGALGYPVSDPTPGGRQTFEHGTLAGNPVQLVSGAILTKWGALGYETGVAGSPTSAAADFLTFRATSGTMQSFQNAVILALPNKAFAVTGLILAKYNANGGPGGPLGAPTGDEFSASGRRHQDFEGGYIDYASGDATANLVQNPRQPLVTATPGSVLGGTRVRLAVGGFDSGAIVRVSVTGQSDFIVTLASGAYSWDSYVPAAAKSGVIAIRAVQINGTGAAQGSYTIRAISDVRLSLTAARGDGQTGAPGTLLAQPLRVSVKDDAGNSVPGQTVTFAASPGAQIVSTSGPTDANGEATATLRLQPTEGIALATAQAAHQVVTFSARATAFSLPNFPMLTQAGNGALLTAAASILRYHQSRGELPQPNGLADPASLNSFLKSFCVFDAQGNQICDGFITLGGGQTVNLWRLGAFVSNSLDVSVEDVDLNLIRDLVASGSPVLLALALNANQDAHFVVAIGIASDASLTIADPALAHTSLNDYLNAKATVTGAVRLIPRVPSSAGFLIASTAPVEVSSTSGSCGRTLQFPGALRFRYCDGAAGPYQLDLNSSGQYQASFTDLSSAGGRIDLALLGASSAKVARAGAHWTVAPLDVSFGATPVVNAASFTSDIAPGGLIAIFGAGFSRPGSDTTVQINGVPAPIVGVFPFQVNAQIPPDAVPGPATLSIASGNGTAQQSITIRDVAPGIFSVAPGQAAITNYPDNQLNTPSNPASRGTTVIIYGTGFGSTAPIAGTGSVSPARTPLAVILGGQELSPAYAGLTPGVIGLYQVNLAVPLTLPPGLSIRLSLRQAGMTSNTVSLAVQ